MNFLSSFSSFFLLCFKTLFKIFLQFSYPCFHRLLFSPLFSSFPLQVLIFFNFQITSPHFHFVFYFTCFLFFYFTSIFVLFYQSHNYFSIVFTLPISSPFSPITSSVLFFFFSLSLTKKNFLAIQREHKLLMLLSPSVPMDSTRIAYML